jgi:8-oxo-dGTP diphosphatase
MANEQMHSKTLPEAIVAVVTKKSDVLIILRGANVPYAGYWAPPSGKIEHGEPQAEALVREVREEIGLTVKPIRKVWENFSPNGSHRLHWWLAEWQAGDFKLDKRDVADALWISVEDLLRFDKIFSSHREFFVNIFPNL